jgi:hypothetical protein
MPTETREVRPCSKPRHVLSADARVLAVPDDWALLPPGDAALSRRIKQDGPTWTVIEQKGRKRFSHGIWAPAARNRRAAEQTAYAAEFEATVLAYLDFHPAKHVEAALMARLITDHAVPVGSGTVARTERIPIEERAEAATIAWMRHQTTGYDTMVIPLVKGRRREVRRMLAQRSVQLLARYRQGQTIDPDTCPLARALAPHQPKPPQSPASAQLGLGL